jgi:hypothetical protein
MVHRASSAVLVSSRAASSQDDEAAELGGEVDGGGGLFDDDGAMALADVAGIDEREGVLAEATLFEPDGRGGTSVLVVRLAPLGMPDAELDVAQSTRLAIAMQRVCAGSHVSKAERAHSSRDRRSG